MRSTVDTAPSAAERFLTAWKTLEAELCSRHQQAHPNVRSDTGTIIRWAERTRLLSSTAAEFIFRCRDARNAYAHICFDGYEGPVTNPPIEVTYRLERLAVALQNPARVNRFAAAAVTGAETCRLDQALAVMRQHDYSQLPYHHRDFGWLLVTREQVARWLEAETDVTGTAFVDLTNTVGSLASDPRIGPVRPRTVEKSATVSEALDQLESALCTPDSADGGYAAVLVLPAASHHPPRIITSDDLPRMYDLLGR